MTFADECEESPCLNGGTCQNQLGTFTCGCKQGFVGDRCEVDIGERNREKYFLPLGVEKS